MKNEKIAQFKSETNNLLGKGLIEETFEKLNYCLIDTCHHKKDLIAHQCDYFYDKKRNLLGEIDAKEFKTTVSRITAALQNIIDTIKPDDLQIAYTGKQYIDEGKFRVINNPEDRTRSIIKDLEKLKGSLMRLIDEEDEIDSITIWSISFLSIFAIDENDPAYTKNEHRSLLKMLNEEKRLFTELARLGCKIKCIISPANENHLHSTDLDYALYRTNKLIEFLEKDEPWLSNIEWVASEYGQGHVYIFGNDVLYEGYKQESIPGYGFTLRQEYEQVIKPKIEIYQRLFTNLSYINVANWKREGRRPKPPGKIYFNAPTILRYATISKLYESMDYLEGLRRIL